MRIVYQNSGKSREPNESFLRSYSRAVSRKSLPPRTPRENTRNSRGGGMGGVGVKLKKSQRDSSPRVRPHANHLAVRVVAQSESLGFLQCHFEEGGFVVVARCQVAGSDCPVFCIVHNS